MFAHLFLIETLFWKRGEASTEILFLNIAGPRAYQAQGLNFITAYNNI